MTSTEPKTEEDLKQLLTSYQDGLKAWQAQLSSKDAIMELKAAKVDHPIEELIKLCQIIHANTTKMGIIFTKPLKDVNAAYKQTHDISSTSVLLISLSVQLIESEKFSKLFINEVLLVIRELLSALQSFITELINDEDDKRLVSVGKIWESVTQLTKISKLGKLGVLKLKLKDCTTMINDGIEELNEWIEDPSSLDTDPFAFSDDEEETEEETVPSGSITEEKDEDYSDILPQAKIYLNKIKLIKLLISSLMKSIPTDIKDNNVDEIYNVVKQFSEFVDELIYKLIFENDLNEADVWFAKLGNSSDELISILRKVNVKDDKKLKWLDVWQLKFKDV